jgi:hypothetical protein
MDADVGVEGTGSYGRGRERNHRFRTVTGLVRDGVASIELRATVRGGRRYRRKVEVRDNVFAIRFPRGGGRFSILWRNAEGELIRRKNIG